MKEYYILQIGQTILGVFETLQECLCWRPQEPVQEDPSILRVKHKDDNTFSIQTILVKASVYEGET
jgi:hypothetical protein